LVGFKYLLEIKILKGGQRNENKVIAMGQVSEFNVEQDPEIESKKIIISNQRVSGS
jgi:hypothetical protein